MNRFSRPSSALALLLSCTLASSPLRALAQPIAGAAPSSGEGVARAREHFTRAVKLYEEDDFRTALIEFNRAYELAPNWQVLYNIGQASYQLRDYASALKTLEKYVASGGASIAPDRKQQVDREMEELRGRVAHVTFTSNVSGAEVSIDDVSLGALPLSRAELVGAGRHKVTATKRGWRPATRIIDIAGGDNLTIALDLSQEESAATRETAPSPPAARPTSYGAAIALAGIGVAGIAVGSIFGAAAIDNHSTLSAECSAERHCPYGSQSEIDAFSRNGLVSTIGFGVGAAGVVIAVILFATERAKAAKEGASALKAHPVPTVGLGGAGIEGSF